MAALVSASRVAATRASSRSSSGASPTTTASTCAPCCSSTSTAARLERVREPLAGSGGPLAGEPGAQLPLLPAGELRDLLRLVRALLHQRERLEDRVVQVSRHLGSLLRAGAGDPLRGEPPRHRPPERCRDQDQCDRDDEGGERGAARGLQHAGRPEEEQRPPEDDRGREAHAGDPEGLALPGGRLLSGRRPGEAPGRDRQDDRRRHRRRAANPPAGRSLPCPGAAERRRGPGSRSRPPARSNRVSSQSEDHLPQTCLWVSSSCWWWS